MKPGTVTWAVYYGAHSDGYPAIEHLDSESEARAFYDRHKAHYARLVECRVVLACEGGNPYAGIPAKDIT